MTAHVDAATINQLRAIQACYERSLFALDGVAGMGIGRTDNGVYCFRVYLEHETPDVPSSIEGIPVVTVVTGPIAASLAYPSQEPVS